MIDEKVIKKRVNELWDGIKFLSASKTMNYETVIALTITKINTMMELVGKKDIFTKAEIESNMLLNNYNKQEIENITKNIIKERANQKPQKTHQMMQERER